jgi:small-conductance mechanosensitive channel
MSVLIETALLRPSTRSRKPYGVGDRVFVNAPEDETSTNGSAGWFVRDITLYHTTLVFGATNEYCTISNGSLANLRVINAARSPKAILYIFLKFGTEVPWSKIQIFENTLREFVKSRPREWLGINGFRTSEWHVIVSTFFVTTEAPLTLRLLLCSPVRI